MKSNVFGKYLYTVIITIVVQIFSAAPVWADAALRFPEKFPLPMTFRAFDNTALQTEEFKKRLEMLAPYPFIHEIGANKKRNKKVRVMHQRWPNKIFTIQDAYGGIGEKDYPDVWPGHLLYKTGSLLTQDISASDHIIEIEDADRIAKNSTEIQKQTPFSLVIYALDDAGKPDWGHAEHVFLKDIQNGKLVIERGQWASKPQIFKAKKAVVAAHMLFWTHQWQLNLSLHCPRGGSDNLTAAEWFARKAAQKVIDANADGIEFDVARWTWGSPETNTMDANNDLIPDYGYIDGVNSFGLGGRVFFQALRQILGPNKIIQADSNNAISGVRDWLYLNGVQLEAFPNNNDLDRFSEAFLHFRLWVENTKATPAFSYAYTRVTTTTFANAYLPNGKSTDFRFRVNFAAANMVGMPHPFATPRKQDGDPESPSLSSLDDSEKTQDKLLFNWDEYHAGELQNLQWLGSPIELAHQDLSDLDKNNLLDKTEWQWLNSKEYPAKLNKTSDIYSATVESLPNDVVPNQRWFGVRLEPKKQLASLTTGKEYTVEFEARGDDSWHYAGYDIDLMPRMITVGGAIFSENHKPLSILANSQWHQYRISFIADSSMLTTPVFGVSEQIGTTEIRNIKLYAGGAERWSREFENGLVLLNMTNAPWTIAVPKGKYKRLKGQQAPEVNNGQVVDSELTIPARDALFLLKTATIKPKL
jgi:hypothetical protein